MKKRQKEKTRNKDKKDKNVYVYGKHALVEALINVPHVVKKVFLSTREDKEINEILKKNNIESGVLSSNTVAELERGASHQGVIGQINTEKLVQQYGEFINNLEIASDTSLVVLGEIQDPQNVGAIIRSAAAFGISGVLLPEHNQAPITGSVVKVSAGMVFRVPIVSIGNINDILRDLKKRGFWIYGLNGTAKSNITEEKFDKPTVFVLGNESKGIREKTFELCDIPISIPMNKKCESLNVATAAAVSFYAWSKQHPKVLK